MAASITFLEQSLGSINERDSRFITERASLSSVESVIRAQYPTADLDQTNFTFFPDFDSSSEADSSDFSEISLRISLGGRLRVAVFTKNDNADEPNEAFSLQPRLVQLSVREINSSLLADLNSDEIAALFAPSGGLTLNLGKITGTIIDNDAPVNQPPTAINFINTTPALDENTSTADPIKVADITISDDGLGTNVLSLTGSDARLFLLRDNTLYLNPGIILDYETKPSYSVTVNVDDSSVGNTPDISKTFTLSVNDLPENVAPVANPDTKSTNQNTPVTISAAELLINDTDANGDTLSITGVSNGSGGTVSFSNGNILFTPNADFTGAASFNYTLSDGQETATTTVTVNVAPVASLNRSGGNSRDTLTGGLGRDTLSGGNGDDLINGGAGGDTLRGDNGNDTLIGGTGSDIVTGGNGDDVFVLAAGAGTDTITDFKIGTDVIGLSGGLSFGQLARSGNTISANGEVLATLTGVNTSTLTQSNFIAV